MTESSQPLDKEDTAWGQMLSRHGVHTQMIWDTPMQAMDCMEINSKRDPFYRL